MILCQDEGDPWKVAWRHAARDDRFCLLGDSRGGDNGGRRKETGLSLARLFAEGDAGKSRSQRVGAISF